MLSCIKKGKGTRNIKERQLKLQSYLGGVMEKQPIFLLGLRLEFMGKTTFLHLKIKSRSINR